MSVRNNPERAMKMTQALMTSPKTYEQLTEVSGLSKVAVATWVKAMRKAGFVHVGNWTEDVRGRMFTPVFVWGEKPDVARAGQARTSAERMRAYRERLKAGAK